MASGPGNQKEIALLKITVGVLKDRIIKLEGQVAGILEMGNITLPEPEKVTPPAEVVEPEKVEGSDDATEENPVEETTPPATDGQPGPESNNSEGSEFII